MAIRQVNAGTFSDFLICPSLYFYRNIENLAEILSGHNEESRNGEIIHQIIDASFKGIPVSLPYIDTNPKIKQWWNFYKENYQPAGNHEIYSEWSFNIPVRTPLEQVIISGRIDRFSIEGDKITIYDWKSGIKNNLNDLVNLSQMEFYAYALNKIKGIEDFEVKIVYLELREETTLKISKNDLQSIEEKLFRMVKGTHPDIKNFIPHPVEIDKGVPACTVCHFFSLCENLL